MASEKALQAIGNKLGVDLLGGSREEGGMGGMGGTAGGKGNQMTMTMTMVSVGSGGGSPNGGAGPSGGSSGTGGRGSLIIGGGGAGSGAAGGGGNGGNGGGNVVVGGYALCRLRRVAGEVRHPSVQAGQEGSESDSFRADVSHLPSGKVVGTDGADAVMGMVGRYGTHVVAAATVGDVIFQVFSFSPSFFRRLLSIHQDPLQHPLSGPEAEYFSLYTKKAHGGEGWAWQVGKLHIASEDPAFSIQVKSGLWKDTKSPSGENSIFQYWENPETYQRVNTDLMKKDVPIGLKFVSISMFFGKRDVVAWWPVLRAAWYARYGTSVRPLFPEVVEPQKYINTFKPPTIPVSPSIYCPRIDLYLERLSLDEIQSWKGAAGVKSVLILANVIHVSGKVVIPGEHIVIIAQTMVSLASPQRVPEIVVSDSALDSLLLYVHKFIGTVCFSTVSGKRKVVQDGHVVFNLVGDSVKLMPLYPSTHFPRSLTEACVAGVPFWERISILIDISIQHMIWILLRRPSETASSLVSDYLKWISSLIPEEDNVNEALLRSKVSAMNLKVRANLPSNYLMRFVPYTSYAQISEAVGPIADLADTYARSVCEVERSLETIKIMEANTDPTKIRAMIKQTGEAFVNTVKSNSKAQHALADCYANFIDKLQSSIRKADDDIAILSDLVEQQRVVVQERITAFKGIFPLWQESQQLSFILSTVGSIFSLHSAPIFLPNISSDFFNDAGGLMIVIQKIKKFSECLSVVDNIRKATSTFKNLSLFAKVLVQIDTLSLGYLSTAEWQLFQKLTGDLFSGSTEEVKKLRVAYSILIARGQSYFQALYERANLMRLLDDNEEMKRVAGRLLISLEAKELKELDPDRLDLASFTNSLSCSYSRCCTMLASIAAVQNQCLRYELSAAPVSIGSDLSLINLLYAIKQQKIQATPEALNAVPSGFTPVTISVDVPTRRLTDGNQFTFSIPLCTSQFWPFVLVRVSKITASVVGIDSTESGKYQLHVRYSGNPFFDRDANRNPQRYYTVARNYEYRYNIRSGICETSNIEDISQITPFSDWTFSLPQVFNNQGIKFIGKKVQIKLTFEGQALLKEQHILPRPSGIIRGKAFTSSPVFFSNSPPSRAVHDPPSNLSLSSSASSTIYSAPSSPSSSYAPQTYYEQPTLNFLVNGMVGRDTMGGWDVVVVVELDTLNSVLKSQYHDSTNYKNVPRTLKFESAKEGKNHTKFVTQIELQLDQAVVDFVNFIEDSAYVKIKVLSGSYSTHFVTSRGEREEFDGPTPIDVGYTLESEIPIKYARATPDEHGTAVTVVLDMSYGNWQMTGGNSNFDTKINESINKAFTAGSFYYSLTRILTTPFNGSKHNDFQPRDFRVSLSESISGVKAMTVFISTSDSHQHLKSFSLNESLPLGYEVAMFVSNRLLMSSILRDAFDRNTKFKVESVAVDDKSDLQTIKVKSGVIKQQVEFTETEKLRISAASSTVRVDFSGMSIVPGNLGLAFLLKKSWDQVAEASVFDGEEYVWHPRTLPITIRTSGVAPLALQSDQNTVQVSINVSSTSCIVLDSIIESDVYDNNPFKSQFSTFFSQLQGQLLDTLNSVKFDGLSVLALKYITFPNKFMKFNNIVSPNSLVLLGGLEDKK